ncbi:MAG: hypothetical protein K6E91_01995 [Butyrivibrio sp.]|nr:hypothetical protein [Butyrivibrio sp.]
MYYSVIGVLALLILLTENQDIISMNSESFNRKSWKVYRRFLFAVMLYYITDILWGCCRTISWRPHFIGTRLYILL